MHKQNERHRVRKSWIDEDSQKAFLVLDNARICVGQNPEYSEFESSGKAVCASAVRKNDSFMVRVSIPAPNIRSGSDTSYASNGYTWIGVFTIVDVSGG